MGRCRSPWPIRGRTTTDRSIATAGARRVGAGSKGQRPRTTVRRPPPGSCPPATGRPRSPPDRRPVEDPAMTGDEGSSIFGLSPASAATVALGRVSTSPPGLERALRGRRSARRLWSQIEPRPGTPRGAPGLGRPPVSPRGCLLEARCRLFTTWNIRPLSPHRTRPTRRRRPSGSPVSAHPGANGPASRGPSRAPYARLWSIRAVGTLVRLPVGGAVAVEGRGRAPPESIGRPSGRRPRGGRRRRPRRWPPRPGWSPWISVNRHPSPPQHSPGTATAMSTPGRPASHRRMVRTQVDTAHPGTSRGVGSAGVPRQHPS